MKKVSISFLSVGYLGHAVTILQSVKRTLTEKNVSLHTLIEIINSGGMTDEGNDLVLNYLLEMKILHQFESDELPNSAETYVEISKSIIEILDEKRVFINRELLWQYIETTIPPWTRNMKHGIEQTRKGIADPNMKQIFRENGLFITSDEQVDIQIMEWWNRAKRFSRLIQQTKNVETGDKGEELTIHYETQRTSQTPKLVSLQSDSYGYDVLSVEKHNSLIELFIEVKTTSIGWNRGNIHITAHEAEKCESLGGKYVFYLWNIQSNPYELKVIKANQMSTFFPLNQGSGKWESVKIPLREFNDSKIIKYKGD